MLACYGVAALVVIELAAPQLSGLTERNALVSPNGGSERLRKGLLSAVSNEPSMQVGQGYRSCFTEAARKLVAWSPVGHGDRVP